MWNSTLRERFNFCFQGIFASFNKIFTLGEDWAQGYQSAEF